MIIIAIGFCKSSLNITSKVYKNGTNISKSIFYQWIVNIKTDLSKMFTEYLLNCFLPAKLDRNHVIFSVPVTVKHFESPIHVRMVH